MMRAFGSIAILVLTCGSITTAGVFSPRIAKDGEPDDWSALTLLSTPAWKETSDAGLARRLVMLHAHGTDVTPFSPREGTEKAAAWATVNDPLKLRHAYGFADRAAIADAFAALWSMTNRGAVRIIELSESPHVLVEIETTDRWGVIDPASRAVFVNDTDQIAMWDEIMATPKILHELPESATVHTAWTKSKLTRRASRGSASHTASFSLRRGERFTRFATPQSERWQLTDAELKDKPRVTFWNETPRGPKAEKEGAVGYAQGRFEYEPSLKDDGADIRDGADVLHNVTVTPDGLTLIKAGEGSAIVRVASPFPIVGLVGKIEDAKDDKEASVIEIDGTGTTLSYSKDFGATWLSLDIKKWPATVDLTQQIAGEYSYQLRIELKGKPGEAIVRSLKMTTWVQCSPRSFPALTTGENTFRIRTGDERGLPTRALVLNASTADENGFLRPVIRPPKDYRPGDAKERVIGPFTMRVAALPGSQIAWLQLGGRFATKTDSLQPELVSWSVATGSPQNFQPVKLGRLAAEMDAIYTPPEPVPAVYFHVEGRPALNELRVTAHCLDESRDANSPWRIIHRWTGNNESREHTVAVTEQETYTVPVGDAALSEQSVEFVVPGSLAR